MVLISDSCIVIWHRGNWLWGQGTKNLSLYVCKAGMVFLRGQIHAEEALMNVEDQIKTESK